MRLDKFLKVSRILKRRTVAKEACDGGKVLVNGKEAKPAHELKLGDVVEIRFASGGVKFEVLAFLNSTKKEDAEKMYRLL